MGRSAAAAPRRFFQSTGLTEVARTLIRTSPSAGSGRSTSASSRTSGLPVSRMSTACMAAPSAGTGNPRVYLPFVSPICGPTHQLLPTGIFPPARWSVRPGRGTLGGVVVLLVTRVLAGAAPTAAPDPKPPIPESNFAGTILPRPCALEGNDPYERRFYEQEGWGGPNYERSPGACQRLRFAYGPILVKPGQNDVLVGPVTIEKPAQNGYITRFRPDLVRQDGTVPPIEQVHLHHGTWLSEPDYGRGPFFAA